MLANESPLKQKFDKFDIEHIDWYWDDYKKMALQEPVEKTGKLLVSDWTWRAKHHQNIVASWNGGQGTGKSKPALYGCCLLGNIYRVPFRPDHMFWDLTQLQEAIPNLPPRCTVFKDEHRHGQSGHMAKKEAAHMNDLVEQLREPKQINFIFASVFEEIHADFFQFEAKNINWNKDGTKPLGFFSMLSTPRYTDLSEFVWRGMVYFPMPPNEIEIEYTKRKIAAQKNLENQNSSTLNAVEIVAKKIFGKRLPELTRETRTGIKVPLQSDLMMILINEEIGSSRFTIPVYKQLIAVIRDMVEKCYRPENEQIELKVFEEKQKAKQQAKELQDKIDAEKNEQRKIRFELMRQKIEEMRKARQLKETIRAEKQQAIAETPSDSDKNRTKLSENQEKAMQNS